MIIIKGTQSTDVISHESLALALETIFEHILTPPFLITSGALVSVCCDASTEEAHSEEHHFSKHHLKIEQLPMLLTG